MKLRHILALVLGLSLLVTPVSAATQPETVEQALLDACIYGTETDLSEFRIQLSKMEETFYSLYDEGKLPWYCERTYTGHYNEETGIVLDFTPSLLNESQYDRSRYEQRVAEALAQCVLPDMTPVQKALAIHDWLIVNCIYDESLEKNTGYDLLVDGTTVCAGYAAAYQDLLTRVGIPCRTVVSEEMNHAWNLVQLDGQWYHVDVTWDDPSPDRYGQVLHDYFLVTDQEISAGDDPHYDWETDIACTDTRFSDAWWKNTTGQICFIDSNTVCFLRTRDWDNFVYVREEATGNETLLYKEKENYVNLGEGKYCYSHGSLSLWNGRLYYNRQDRLLSFDTDGEDQRTEYTHSTRKSGTYIYSCNVANDTLYVTFSDHDGQMQTDTIALEESGYHVHSYTQTVEAPTCTQPGYTLSTCQCGLTAKSLPTATLEHTYEEVDKQNATIFSSGWIDRQCSACGDSITEHLPRIEIVEWLLDHKGVCVASVTAIIVLCSKAGKKKAKT